MNPDDVAARELQEAAQREWHVRWAWPDDMNGDGVQTIADTWAWVKAVFFAPGDFILLNFMRTKPAAAHFWELSPAALGGVLSGFISLALWAVCYGMLIGFAGSMRDIVRRK